MNVHDLEYTNVSEGKEALVIKCRLRLPTCVIKKLLDGIFLYLYGVRLRVTLFAAQMAGGYRGAGAEPGLEIWRIENKVPVVAHILKCTR